MLLCMAPSTNKQLFLHLISEQIMFKMINRAPHMTTVREDELKLALQFHTTYRAVSRV